MSEQRAIDRFARLAAQRVLRTTKRGYVEVVENGERTEFGDPGADLRARLQINDPRAWTGMLRGSTGFGEGYVDGYWDSDDLVDLVRIAARNTPAMDALKRRFAFALVPAQSLGADGPAQHAARRPAEHLRPLRPRQRAVRVVPRRAHAVLLGLLPQRRSRRSRRPSWPSSTGSATACASAPTTTCSRSAPAGAGWRSMRPTKYGCRVTTTTISRRAAHVRDVPDRRARALGRGSRSCSRTTATSGHLRQARLDRDDRGGRLAVLQGLLPQVLRAAARRTG